MSVDSVTQQATHAVIAALLVVAALIVMVALTRAILDRRRLQLIISDIVEAGRPAATEMTTGLSASLRQQVRTLLAKPSKVGRPQSLTATVGQDIADQLTGSFTIDDKQLERIQQQIISAPCREILSSARNDLAAVSGGIRAMAPEQAQGFVDALAAALPGQRGLQVISTALTRQYAGREQSGLTVEIGTLGRAPEALATFWSDLGRGSQRDQLERLLEPAARWIALHVTGRIAVDGVRRWRLGVHLIGDLRTTRQQRVLRDILTAQLGGYAMNELLRKNKPWAALAFSQQALVDAQTAKAAVPNYHRPNLVAGLIHQHTGVCYLVLSRAEATEWPRLAAMHRTYAREAFAEAIRDFNVAESLVKDTQATDKVKHERITQSSTERLWSGLNLGDGSKALKELARNPIRPFDPLSYYNGACLYATAAAVLRENGQDNSAYRARAMEYLRVVIVQTHDAYAPYWSTEDALLREFTVAELRQVAAEVERERVAPQTVDAVTATARSRTTRGPGAGNPRTPASRGS